MMRRLWRWVCLNPYAEIDIRFTSNPPGATVWVADFEAGQTEIAARVDERRIGDIRLTLEGYDALYLPPRAIPAIVFSVLKVSLHLQLGAKRGPHRCKPDTAIACDTVKAPPFRSDSGMMHVAACAR